MVRRRRSALMNEKSLLVITKGPYVISGRMVWSVDQRERERERERERMEDGGWGIV